jgi:hypothetical protein
MNYSIILILNSFSSLRIRYQKLFLQELLLHVLDVRDSLDVERFLHVHFDPVFEAQSASPNTTGHLSAPSAAGESEGINFCFFIKCMNAKVDPVIFCTV